MKSDYLKIKSGSQVLLLNADYNPIQICSYRKAVVLSLKNKVQIVSNQVIRLLYYINLPVSRMMCGDPTRQLIYKRDDRTCGYCGSIKDLTIDHIIPKSRGGPNTWENLICACVKCNVRKGNRTPQEAGMVLYTKPKKPFNRITLILEKSGISDWKEYLYS